MLYDGGKWLVNLPACEICDKLWYSPLKLTFRAPTGVIVVRVQYRKAFQYAAQRWIHLAQNEVSGGLFEYGTEPPGSMKYELSDYQLFEEDSAP